MSDATALGHRFADATLLERALTHRSAAHANNERLEFLGDALLNLLVAELIYETHPRASEGDMTRLRAALVNGNALAEMARTHQLGDRLHLGPGELKSGGHRRDSILADAVEAVVAAVYLDSDFDHCREVVLPWFEPALAALPPPNKVGKDAKTRLQEWLQARQRALPVYELVSESGDDHAKVFRVACALAEPAMRAEGEGSSRRAAEQVAAEAVLEQVERR